MTLPLQIRSSLPATSLLFGPAFFARGLGVQYSAKTRPAATVIELFLWNACPSSLSVTRPVWVSSYLLLPPQRFSHSQDSHTGRLGALRMAFTVSGAIGIKKYKTM